MNDVPRQNAGFMHVHLTDNPLYNSSCVGNLVQPWWSFQMLQSNRPWVCYRQKQAHFRMWCCFVSMVFILIFWYEDAEDSKSSKYHSGNLFLSKKKNHKPMRVNPKDLNLMIPDVSYSLGAGCSSSKNLLSSNLFMWHKRNRRQRH